MVAEALGSAGDEVHVWCPNAKGEVPRASGVLVHRELGLAARDLRRAGRLLDRFDGPRRLLVQWVPHGYGYRAMNLPFCLWLWRRARRHGDRIELIVHEPFLSFGEGTWRQDCVAVVHRLMTVVLLNAASRVWTTIPAWEERLRPYALGRRNLFHWLPVASNIPVVDDPPSVDLIRSRYAGARGAEGLIVGHFGTYDRNTANLLLRSIPALLKNGRKPSMLLLGRGSTSMRDQLIREHPGIANDVHATGELESADLSRHLRACDLMLQPYIDGVSGRRTTIMAQLSLGLPVVTTAGKLTEPLWAESRAVALTPAGDVSRMVEATNRLLGDEGERKRLAAAARSLYLSLFDIEHTVAALRAQPLTLGAK